jgi:general secretion pathway protein G
MKKAFTIVELLVVMAVIGILITLAVVGIQAIQKAQRETVRLNDVRSVQSTLESYYSKFKKYPAADGQAAIGAAYAAGASQNLKWASGTSKLTFGDPAASPSATDSSFSLVFQALGVVPVSSTGAGKVGTCNAAATNLASSIYTATADVWYVVYKTSTGSANPQSYSLYACTENGFSDNFGSY